MSNMAVSLIMQKKIETTLAKAKALRMYVEPLITKSKQDTTASRRMVFSYLKQKEAVSELFKVVAPKVGDRPGGYTRIVKTDFRVGDNAEMAIIELVDFNESALESAKETKKSSTRRGRKKKVDATVEVPSKAEETVAEAPATEEAPKTEETPKAE
jgi:large subunit ribosomal protein L17